MSFPTLEDAREAAESYVDDRDADRAHLTALLSTVDETYTRNNGWEEN